MPDDSLRERFQRECPHIDVGYVAREAPGLEALARQYMQSRRLAATDRDVDACAAFLERLVGRLREQGVRVNA